MTPAVPSVAETKPAILKRIKEAELEKQLAAMRTKYKGFGDDLLYWMIAQNNRVEVADIKAGDSSGEGDEVSIAQMETFAEDPDVLDTWTQFVGAGKIEKPRGKPAKYSLPTAAVVDIIHGETANGPKIDLVLSDGTGTLKCVAYAKACDMVIQNKVKVGDVVRLPLLSAQYGHWTKKGAKGQEDEQVLWYKFGLPPFGAIHKLDLPITQFLKNLDQVVVKAKDACFVDGIITNIDQQTNDICTKCFRWWDEKKPQEHKGCKGAEIVEETAYVGTITTTSSQIHKLLWSANPRAEVFQAKKPKINVGEDVVRIFGTLTEKNTVLVTGYTVIDSEDIQVADEEDEAPAPKASRKPGKAPPAPEPADEDEEDEEEDDEAPAAPVKPAKRRVPTSVQEETEEDSEEDDEVPSPPRRRRPEPEPDEDAEDDDEEEEEDEAPSPPPRRRVGAKAPAAEPEDDEEEDEEDDSDEEDVVAAPPARRRAVKAPVEGETEDEEEDEDDDIVVKAATKTATASKKPVKANGSAGKVTEFIVQALTNFGGPQRSYLIARAACKKGLVQCDDIDDADAVKEAFQPHLDAAIESGAIKFADDKQQKIWLGKVAA